MVSNITVHEEVLDTAIRSLFQIMKRPQSWTVIQKMAHTNIDRPAAVLLMTINAHPSEAIKLQDIAVLLNIEAPSVTRKAQQLEHAGLVQRLQDAKDRRSFTLKTTREGSALSTKIKHAQREIIRNVLDDWEPSERERFTILFDKFSHDLGHYYSKHA